MDGTAVEVRAVESVGSDTVAVELETPPEFDAAPGQFVTVEATIDGESVTRYYTLSSPNVDGTFEVTVEVDPEGELGPWLADADSGTVVEVAGPFGRSSYEGEERLVVIAGGPGVGPAVGIGERALDDGNEVAIVYRDETHAHGDRLHALEDAGVPTLLLDGDEGLTDALAQAIDTVGGQVFVYGFAAFVEEARDVLDEMGIDPTDAKVENFG